MNKINSMLIAVIVASLILVAGCYDNVTEYENPVGYDGFVNDGWAMFEAGDYDSAMVCFQNAIDMDVSQPDAYLGAGWCSILLPDYWVIGDQYDFMAMQQDGGTWPITVVTTTVTQDIPWSEFECVYPVLTANDLTVINAFGTTDTLIIDDSLVVFEPDSVKPAMDNLEIGNWLYARYSTIRFQYKYVIDNPNVTAMFVAANGFSLVDAAVDSIVQGATTSTVYISVPHVRVKVGEDFYRTWCMNENAMTFEYAIYAEPAGQTDITLDAVAAYGVLQDARGENGNTLQGVATLVGLADSGVYTFSHYAGIDNLKLKGMAAAMAYRNMYFRPALGICRSEGYGLDIEMSDPDFLVELMQAIEMMLL